MGKPRMIILIRHAQSEGNKNRDIHQAVPDHRVKLTPEGHLQAEDAGRRLRQLLRPDDTLHFFTSPYRRTRQTTEGILSTLTSDDPSASPFPRHSIKVYEEPRLREQDFGNFQPCSAEMERMWQERADYGHFFYRIPNGESAADAYDRISGFNESLWRQFGEDDFASVCVLVTHGLMSRVFLMKWYHYTVEYFEDLRNINHCEFLIMRKESDSGKYTLENELRTWSQLKRDKEAALLKNGAIEDKDEKKLKRALVDGESGTGSPVPHKKKWGGCPDGCDHARHYYKKGLENPMHAMARNGKATQEDSLALRRPAAARRWQSSSGEEDDSDHPDDPRGILGPPRVDVQRSLDDPTSSPDGTPSFISVEDRLRHRIKSPSDTLVVRAGRDFGGSASGNTSQAGSDTEFSAEEDILRKLAQKNKVQAAPKKHIALQNEDVNGGMGRGAKADALGDQSHVSRVGSDVGDGTDVCLSEEERMDKSISGSVY